MKKIIKIMLALTISVMMIFTFGCSQADIKAYGYA